VTSIIEVRAAARDEQPSADMDDLLVSRYVNAFWACRIMTRATDEE
jgi:hypothetical protein